MLGSPCSPCCESCTPSRIAEIVSVLRSASCELTWTGADIKLQEAATTGDRFVTSLPWNAYAYAAGALPPSSLMLALDMSTTTANYVTFRSESTSVHNNTVAAWNIYVTLSVNAAASPAQEQMWPSTRCSVNAIANIELRSMTNVVRGYIPASPYTSYYWTFPAAYKPSGVALPGFFAVPEDLSAQIQRNPIYENLSLSGASLVWGECGKNVTSCDSNGLQGTTLALSFPEASRVVGTGNNMAGAFSPPRRWKDGVYGLPAVGSDESRSYTGRITSIEVTLSLT